MVIVQLNWYAADDPLVAGLDDPEVISKFINGINTFSHVFDRNLLGVLSADLLQVAETFAFFEEASILLSERYANVDDLNLYEDLLNHI